MYTQVNNMPSPKRSVRNGLMASCIAALGFATPVRAGDTIQTFDPAGSASTVTTGINDSGAVTGYYAPLIITSGLGTERGFVRAPDGNVVTFAPEGASATYAESIDTNGAVAGFYTDPSTGTQRGFLRTAGPTPVSGDVITVFDAIDSPRQASTYAWGVDAVDPPKPASTYAWGISNGEIVGSYTLDSLTYHGFVRHADGSIERFDPPGSGSTYAMSINAGAVTGYYSDPDASAAHCFVRFPTSAVAEFDAPGSLDTKCYSIDASGWVAGSMRTHDNRTVGFVRSPAGSFTYFPGEATPGSTTALAINNKKAIAGVWYDGKGKAHGLARSYSGKNQVFDPAKSTATYAVSINSKDAIAGYWKDNQGTTHGFVRQHLKSSQN